MRYLFWIVLPLLSLAAFPQSERYNFSKLNTYTGLSHNQVNAILKDADGFLWFGTLSGLNRYDGSSFKVFSKKHNDSTSITDNNVQSLFALPDGKMWLITRGGPCIYDPVTEKFGRNCDKYLRSLGLPAGNINDLIKGNDGRYWFIYGNNDLYLYSVKEKRAKLFRKNTPADKITSIAEAKGGKLWLVYQNGFLQQYDIKLNEVVFTSTAFKERRKGDNINSLFVDSDGDVWIWSYPYGAFLFHPPGNSIRHFDKSTTPSRLNSDVVSEIVQDNNGLIWVSTDHGGVTLIDKRKNFQTSFLVNDPNDPKSLSQNSITSLYKDDNGIIWLGTYKQGVNFLNDHIVQFAYYHHNKSNENSLPYDDVNRFVEDKHGNLWIGTNGGGLIYFDRKENTFRQYLHNPNDNNSLSSNVIVSLCIDHEGMLWIGTYLGGLNSFDGKKFTQYRHNSNDSASVADDNIWEVFEDRDHNLWIATLSRGLDVFHRKTKRFEHYQYRDGGNNALPLNVISAFIQDKKGNLWIGSVFGITVFEKNKTAPVFYQHTDNKNSLSHNSVTCLLEDSGGNIWAGTREGLNVLNVQTREFQTFTTADGLPDDMILNVLEDDQQTLWVSTPNGLCNVIPKKDKNALVLSIINYDETNNLQNREFNEKAAFKTRAGELIFGGPFGFNIIDPQSINKRAQYPKIVFTGLQILNKNVEPGETVNNRVLLEAALPKVQGIELKHSENVFSIDFASLDFIHNKRDKYAYMLEGFNADWLYADGAQRRATYTNLDPGRYVFKVKVLNRNGLWSEVKTLQIRIMPPFWRTPLAYFIYALLAAALFLLTRRITLDRIHMRYEVVQQRREAERAHAMEQLKTKFFTNVSHEFRTPLSLILAPLEKIIRQTPDEEQKKQLNLVQRNAKRLLSLVNQLLDFRKMEVQEVRLHPSVGDIIGFSREISHSFSDIAEKKKIRFSFSSNVDSLEIYFDRDKLEKILFNLLSNAFKYTHDQGTVTIDLVYNQPADSEREGTLAIEVKDTGIGIPAGMHERIFERFYQADAPESMVNQGTGIGLAITKEFVKLHNGIISVKSEPERGACFTVLLPARKMYEPSTRAVTSSVEETEQTIEEDRETGGKKKTIIIVEDNEDLRFYLKDNLKKQYHIEEAANGKEGWEKIKALNPDLVVSDIMMPLMDGVELARKIKTEMLTAHIPVILLTAMGSEEKQLEGLKAGVNDYVTKPFTFEILASRIRNLMAQQKLLQKRFQKQIEVIPSEVTVTTVDEKFLQQSLEVVEKHLDEPEFSVEDFSREMHMNRVTLYRKILSLTGKTPIEFIRLVRLKRAARLLEKSGLSVAEVAYEVGFNSPKNFAKLFKEEFKMLPTQFAAASKKDKNV